MAHVASPARGAGKNRRPSRSAVEIIEQFGLEVPKQLRWHKWHALEESVKLLCVKNVCTKVMHVTYNLLPTDSAFSVDFPEPCKLSPGMVATIKVYFRPPKRQSYSDVIELLCGPHTILVPLEAVLPASKLQIPSGIDFGVVPAKEAFLQQLPIKNVGDAALQFSWQIEEPFRIVPTAGRLAAGDTLQCEVHFQPLEAAAYKAQAACSLDNGELLTVQIDGMAKFPYLSLEKRCLDMGNVTVGLTAKGAVRFGNHSAVPANFSVALIGGSDDGAISVQPMQGTLQPNSYSVLQVAFSPKSTGTFSCHTFALSTAGGNQVTFTCQGTAVGPQLQLSSRVYSFGNVKVAQISSKVIYLENVCDVPLSFEFLVEQDGVFSLTKRKGVIPPRSMTHTALAFKATVPANYWQRITCLVKDSDPVAIDAIATCYDDNSRPPPMTYKHIAAYLERVAAGERPEGLLTQHSGSTSGRNLSAVTSAGHSTAAAGTEQRAAAIEDIESRTLEQTAAVNSSAFRDRSNSSPLPPTEQQQLVGPDSWQLLFEGLHTSAAVSVSDSSLEFGSCSRLKPCEPRTFTVTNNMDHRLLVSVITPPWQDPMNQDAGTVQVFQAFPDALELPPGGFATVRVAFRPPKDGLYYCQGILLLVRLKAMRSYRLVQDGRDVIPPWYLSIMALGNTYADMNPEYSPKVNLSSESISFPPCRLGEAVYQTLVLHNYGDTLVQFNFVAAAKASSREEDAGTGAAGGCRWFGAFGVLPSQGVLEPRSQRLVALGFKPANLGQDMLKLTCIFNNTPANSSHLLLHGTASSPQLSWDVPDGKLFFRPTCIGASSQRTVTITNVSRVPVMWQMALSKRLYGCVTVEPMMGELRGHESTQVTFSFTPAVQQVYSARAALMLLPPRTTGSITTAAHDTAVSLAAGSLDDPEQALHETVEGDQVLQQAAQPAYEKLITTIIGEATQGALSVEPADISFGVVKVGYPLHRPLTLINQSDGVLHYRIEIVYQLGDGVDGNTAACEFALPVQGESDSDDGSSRRCSIDAQIDEPEGVIGARSSKALTFTLLPRRRGHYKLSLNVYASTTKQVPRPVSVPSVCSAGIHSSSFFAGESQNAESAQSSGSAIAGRLVSGTVATQHIGGSTADAGLEPPSGMECYLQSEQRPPLAAIAVTATAAFPALLVTDVHCSGLPKQVSWQMLGIQQMNTELTSAVSTPELRAQMLANQGSLTNQNAAAVLPPFEVDMGAVAVGHLPRSFWVQLSNNGSLPVDWELHSYDAPQVDLENWVEPARPLSQAEKDVAFVLDNKIFSVSPHSGSLQPGQKKQVCFTFTPVEEGCYQLPKFLRIKDGKQLQLQLKGRAVLPSAQLPLAVRGCYSCVLAPTPLGELNPPLQSYTLRNGGPAPLTYRLDTAPLQQLTKQSYGAEVIKYAGGCPLQGEIQPGDVAVFKWLFQPLEAKQYSVALPLTLGPAAPQPLLLRGRGYHPRQHPEDPRPSKEEAAQYWQGWLGFSAAATVHPPSQVLHVDREILDFGVCLPATINRRLLVLHNTANVPLEFAWDLAVFEEERKVISGCLTVTPSTGRLAPGEKRIFQLTFQAGLAPQLFSGEIYCYARQEQGDDHPSTDGAVLLQCIDDSKQALCTAACSGPQNLDGGDLQEDQEEVFAEHPVRPVRRTSAMKAKISNRLPLHMSMTKAVRQRFAVLDQQYTNTTSLQKLQQLDDSNDSHKSKGVAAPGSPVLGTTVQADFYKSGSHRPVLPQMLTVSLQGSVLLKDQIKSGSYICETQQSSARKLLEVLQLLPMVDQPVGLQLPPGSMGPSAAAAKAIAAQAANSELPVNIDKAASDGLQSSLLAAGAVVQQMLREVWMDDGVQVSLANISEPTTPSVSQLLGQRDVGQCREQHSATTDDGVVQQGDSVALSDASASHTEAPEGSIPAVLQQQSFHAFADYVLDSAILGIMQESMQVQQP